MAIDTRSEILALEKRFWDSMKQKDGDKAGRMTAKRSIIVGAQGVSSIDPATMETLTVEGDWTIDSYEFDDASMQVEVIDEDTAAIAYKVTERIRVGGDSVTLVAHDASVWHRAGGEWRCVLHTESVAGDPFGRGK